MAPETPNLYEVQKTYEALIDPTKKEDQDLNSKLAFDETRIFKTEFERQYYLASLK